MPFHLKGFTNYIEYCLIILLYDYLLVNKYIYFFIIYYLSINIETSTITMT